MCTFVPSSYLIFPIFLFYFSVTSVHSLSVFIIFSNPFVSPTFTFYIPPFLISQFLFLQLCLSWVHHFRTPRPSTHSLQPSSPKHSLPFLLISSATYVYIFSSPRILLSNLYWIPISFLRYFGLHCCLRSAFFLFVIISVHIFAFIMSSTCSVSSLHPCIETFALFIASERLSPSYTINLDENQREIQEITPAHTVHPAISAARGDSQGCVNRPNSETSSVYYRPPSCESKALKGSKFTRGSKGCYCQRLIRAQHARENVKINDDSSKQKE